MKCSGFACDGKVVAVVTVRTPRMPAPGFYPACEECLNRRPIGVGPYITKIRRIENDD